MLSFFPRGVLDEILNLIESVSEDFPSNSYSNFSNFMVTDYINTITFFPQYNGLPVHNILSKPFCRIDTSSNTTTGLKNSLV